MITLDFCDSIHSECCGRSNPVISKKEVSLKFLLERLIFFKSTVMDLVFLNSKTLERLKILTSSVKVRKDNCSDIMSGSFLHTHLILTNTLSNYTDLTSIGYMLLKFRLDNI